MAVGIATSLRIELPSNQGSIANMGKRLLNSNHANRFSGYRGLSGSS